MKVAIRFQLASQELTLDAVTTYQKGDMFCVRLKDGCTKKYPMSALFEVVETDDSDNQPK